MEYIGFLISLLALIYLFFKQTRKESGEEENLNDESEETLFEYIPEKPPYIKKVLPPPPSPKKRKIVQHEPIPLENYKIESSIEKRRLKSNLESRQLQSKLRPEEFLAFHEERHSAPSKLSRLLDQLPDKKNLIVYQEMMGKPRALRPYDPLW